MTREELRERVAEAMCDAVNVESTWGETGTLHREKVWFVSADAAIALVLEEAARVALEEYRKSSSGEEIAAAIRALKDKP